MVTINKGETPHSRDSEDKTLSGRTTIALREAIVSGEIAAGEKLNEPRLAEQFDVSRGPLREAIRRLVSMRLVTYVPNQGASVVTLDSQSIVDLYEVREVLEGKAAALAAKNMNEREIEKLRNLLELHHQHHESNRGEYMMAEGDFDFHYQIIMGSGNQLLVNQLCDELYHLIRMFRYQTSRFKTRSTNALIEHGQLVYAIEQRNSELAETVMRQHINRAKLTIQKSLQSKLQNIDNNND